MSARRPPTPPGPKVGKPARGPAVPSLSSKFKQIEHAAVPPRRVALKPRPRVVNPPQPSTPRKPHPAAGNPAPSVIAPPPVTPAAQVPCILVVDDDASIRDLMARVLRRAGWEVELAKDGGEAILKIGAVGEPGYALILLDLMMPIISGFEVIDYFKIHRPSMLSRVVVVTASPKVDQNKISREMIAGVIEKPFDITSLVAFVRPMVEASTARI
jgi:CheY-like chemotaxis protein